MTRYFLCALAVWAWLAGPAMAQTQIVPADMVLLNTVPCAITSGTAAASGGNNCDFYLKSDGTVWVKTGGTWTQLAAVGGLTAHKLLGSTAHDDTLSGTVVLGDVISGNSTPAWQRVAGNTTATKKFLSQTGNGSISALPTWATLGQADVSGLTTTDGPTFAHLHLSDVAAVTTAAESWMGPSSTTGVYFKGGNVGIGTTGPAAKLDVSGATSRPRLTATDAGGLSLLDFYSGTSTLRGVVGASGVGTFIVGSVASENVAIYTANTAKVTIDTNGNVGIGTTGPTFALDILNTVNAVPSLRLTGLTTSNGLRIDSSSGVAESRNWAVVTNSYEYGDLSLRQSTARLGDPIAAGASILYLRNNGNVGIGTTTPTAFKLQVAGNAGPNANWSYDLGLDATRWRSLYAAELNVWQLTAKSVVASIGGEIWTSETTKVTADLASGGTTITVNDNNLANGDRIVLKSLTNIEWMAIASAAGGSAGAYTYTVTRNLDGTGANDWASGTAVVNTGTTGDGMISQYADTSSLAAAVGGATLLGPTVMGVARTGTTWSNLAPRWAIGNLYGLYDTGANVRYGFAAGDYATTWVSADATNGFRVMSGTTPRMSIDTSGVLTLRSAMTGAYTLINSTGLQAFTVGNAQRVQLGLLSSTYDYGAGAVNGLAVGPPPSEGNFSWMSVDGSNGFRVMYGSTVKVQVNNSGDAFFTGTITAVTGSNIANWITATNVMQSVTGIVGMSSDETSESVNIWAGCTYPCTPGDAKFHVHLDGEGIWQRANFSVGSGMVLTQTHDENVTLLGGNEGATNLWRDEWESEVGLRRVVPDTAFSYKILTHYTGGDYTGKFTFQHGLQIGAPSGGDQGAGTVNVAGGVYVNGTELTNFSWPSSYGQTINSCNSVTMSVTDGLVTSLSCAEPRVTMANVIAELASLRAEVARLQSVVADKGGRQ